MKSLWFQASVCGALFQGPQGTTTALKPDLRGPKFWSELLVRGRELTFA